MTKKSKKNETYHIANTKNSIVRGLLSMISNSINSFDKDDKDFLLKYFDNKCAYTGEKLTKTNISYDHLLPANIQFGGLTTLGNMIPTTKKYNGEKSDKRFENLDISVERRNKILAYQKLFSYPKDFYSEDLKSRLEKILKDFEDVTELFLNESLEEISKNNIEIRKLNFEEKLEVKKVYSRFEKWKNKNIVPYKIITEYIACSNNQKTEKIHYKNFKNILKEKGYVGLNNLMNINSKNYGKVFEIEGDKIQLWYPVKEYILEHFNS